MGAVETHVEKKTQIEPPHVVRLGLLAGGVAALLATGEQLLVRALWGAPSLPELLGNRVARLFPPSLFETFVGVLGSNAKHLLFYGMVTGQGLVLAAIGAGYVGARRRLARDRWGAAPRWEEALGLCAGLWLLAGLVVMPLAGAGVFGSGLAAGTDAALSALGAAVIYALSYVGIQRVMVMRQGRAAALNVDGPLDPARRLVLKRLAIGAGVVVGGAALWEALRYGWAAFNGAPQLNLSADLPSRIFPPPAPNYGPWTAVGGQTPEVTSVADFYIVSKNLYSDPSPAAATWKLDLSGLVQAPFTLTYDQLRALPSVVQDTTMECISNRVGGNLMSTARFRGVPLKDLLDRAGVRTGATKVTYAAVDGYTDSIHISKAFDEHVLLVYEMNGAPLPSEHGGPVRLLVPGIYGMKSCKWITGIDVIAGDFLGYWEQQGWDDLARIQTTARIDVPGAGDHLPARPTLIAGIAFAGDRGISRVDVSTDAGATWREATLKRPLSNLTWVLWELAWSPQPGNYTIVARAYDGQGYGQTTAVAPPAPSGATGLDAIAVSVGGSGQASSGGGRPAAVVRQEPGRSVMGAMVAALVAEYRGTPRYHTLEQ
jgi:DMSO/TMAO reductase YedYZ molybdopterin-dependent catalytic subunit